MSRRLPPLPKPLPHTESSPPDSNLHPETIARVPPILLDVELSANEYHSTVPGHLEPAEEANTESERDLRRRVEDAQIDRYLKDFRKHVKHVRLASPSDSPVVKTPRPVITDYKFGVGTNEILTGEEVDGPEISRDPWRYTEIDWAAYFKAYFAHLLPPAPPLPPLEPFTVPRLRSNADRLYTVAQPFWISTFSVIGDICLWKNKRKTGIIVVIYAMTILTSTVLPVLLLLPLYPLLKNIFFPTSPLEILRAEEEAKRQFTEVADLVEDAEREGLSAAKNEDGSVSVGMGMKIDIARARRELGIDLMVDELRGIGPGKGVEDGDGAGVVGEVGVDGRGVGELDEAEEIGGTKRKGKDKVKRKKLGTWRKELEDEYGAGAVVVLGDLADVHEKVKNLYLNHSLQTTRKFTSILLLASFVCYITPLSIQVKLFQTILGAVAFVVIPVITAQERYEPMAWMIGGAPTDAEYAVHLLRKRGISKPQRSRTTDSVSSTSTTSLLTSHANTSTSSLMPPSTSSTLAQTPVLPRRKGWSKLKMMGEDGYRVLETSRQVLAGEKGFRVDMGAGGGGEKGLRIGGKGPGMTVGLKDKALRGESITYFAQYHKTPGSIIIDPQTRIFSFRPIVPDKAKPGVEMENVKKKNFDIPFEQIRGLRKKDAAKLLVVIAEGLEVELIDGEFVHFVLVSTRDHAFETMLAILENGFTRV